MKRLGIVFLSLAIAGCGFARSPREDESSYFPMSSRRVWEYQLRGFGEDGVWPVTVRSHGPSFVPELGRVATIFDEEYPDAVVPVAFFLAEGFLQSEIGLRYHLERRVERLPIAAQPMRVMPMPPRVGMRWAYSERVFRGGGRQLGLDIEWSGSVSRAESIDVPAGRFRDCLRVESVAVHRLPDGATLHEFRYVDWYAPNVGLVKNEYATAADVVTRMELVSYADSPAELRPAPAVRLASARRP